MKKKIGLLKEMLSPDFDWEGCKYTSERQLFRECYRHHSYEELGNRPIGTWPCGSARFKDTPKTFYRLLYFLEPKTVSFSDMYKSPTIIEVCSPDYKFCVSFQFYKYELGAYFHCAPEFHNGVQNVLVCGYPGADNSEYCVSETGNLWFDILAEYLNREHLIYGGNNFYV